MVVPETFPCGPLDAVLTGRACQNNQRRALAEQEAGRISLVGKCLTCTCPIKKLDQADAPELPGVRKERRSKLARTAASPKIPMCPEPPDQPPGKGEAPTSPMCKTHPDRPAVVNRKGISMGICRECLVANGQAGGRLTGSPVLYLMREPRHQELLKFLQESAEENERTLEQEVIYRLKKTV